MTNEIKIRTFLAETISRFKSIGETESIIDKIISNTDETRISDAIDRLEYDARCSRTLDVLFRWADSPEGHEYWDNIHNLILALENQEREEKEIEIRKIAIRTPEVVYCEDGKTLLEWANTLPNPQRSQMIYAILNQSANSLRRSSDDSKEYYINTFFKEKHRFISCIKSTIVFSETAQGRSYWNEFFNWYNDVQDLVIDIIRRKRREQEEREEEERRARIEANKLTFSNSFRDMLRVLKNANCKVSSTLLIESYHTREFANYITMRGELASYLPNGREHKTNEETGKWLRDGRQEGKVAKLVKKLLTADALSYLNDADFDKFTNGVKSYISVLGDEDGIGKKIEFKIVSGEDIRKYYLVDNYSKILGEDSNLFGSCMRYENCQSYLDLYVLNPEVCQLLVALDSNGDVLGRSLLWISTEGRKLMDTIYSHESLFSAFKTWAIENEYYYKSSQSCHHESYDMFDAKCHNLSNYVSVKLKFGGLYDEYPYLDTMKWLSDSGILTNEGDKSMKKLTNTDGTCDSNEEGVYSEYHDEQIDEDDAIWVEYTRPSGRRISSWVRYDDCVSDINGDYYLEDDCVEIGHDWYLTNDDSICSDVNGDYQLLDDCVYSDIEGGYILLEDSKEINGGKDYCLTENAVHCAYNNAWYHEDDCVEVEGGEWVHKDVEEKYLLTLQND